ncbi:MAG: hypothetical protein KDA96_09060 [Planctomycetaceae bacterium]|nr:hypothetical protein [Planctomycetaceae bacterium]
MRLSGFLLVTISVTLFLSGCSRDRGRSGAFNRRSSGAELRSAPVDNRSYEEDYSDPVSPIPPEPEFRSPSVQTGVSHVKSVGFLSEVGSRVSQPFRLRRDRAEPLNCVDETCGKSSPVCGDSGCASANRKPAVQGVLVGVFNRFRSPSNRDSCSALCVPETGGSRQGGACLSQFVMKNRCTTNGYGCGSVACAEPGCASLSASGISIDEQRALSSGGIARPSLAELLPDPFIFSQPAVGVEASQNVAVQELPVFPMTPHQNTGAGNLQSSPDIRPFPNHEHRVSPATPPSGPQYVEPPQWPGRGRVAAGESAKSVSWSGVQNWRGNR